MGKLIRLIVKFKDGIYNRLIYPKFLTPYYRTVF